jgi:hypothetical protein
MLQAQLVGGVQRLVRRSSQTEGGSDTDHLACISMGFAKGSTHPAGYGMISQRRRGKTARSRPALLDGKFSDIRCRR